MSHEGAVARMSEAEKLALQLPSNNAHQPNALQPPCSPPDHASLVACRAR